MTPPPMSPAAFLADACRRARFDALKQVFDGDPTDVVDLPGDDHALAGLQFLMFAPSSRVPLWHVVSHGLSQPHLRPPTGEHDAGDRFSGLGIELAAALPVDDDFDPTPVVQHLVDIVEGLVATDPFRTLLPGDVVQIDGAGMQGATAMVVVDGRPFRNRMVLPSGHAHIVQLIALFAEEVDAVAHLSADQRASVFDAVLGERAVGVARASLVDDDAFRAAIAAAEG